MSPIGPNVAANEAALSAGQTSAALASGELSSVELITALRERVAAIDDASTEVALRSVAALADDALVDAQQCDDERRSDAVRGPLHGVPVLIKDNIESKGLPGAAGSTVFAAVATSDAPLVARLKSAGAIVMGSTNLSQWANIRSPRSTSGWSATGGLVANPWSLDRSAGGSSSGSGAAVAAGLAPLAVGTETDGSIVCPASVNGVVGLKPTVGTVSTRQVVPISASQDSPGPMGRTVDDVATMYEVLSGHERPRGDRPRPRIGFVTSWTTGHSATDAAVVALADSLRSAGLTVSDVDAAVPDDAAGQDELTVLLAELADDLSAYLAGREGSRATSLAEVIEYELAHSDIELPYFGHEFFVQAVATGGRRGETYGPARARNLEWALSTCLVPAFVDVDVLLAPSYTPAWKSDLTVGGHGHVSSPATMAPAIAGWPIACVPMGLVNGLPIGAALVGRANDEWTLIDAMREVERVVDSAYTCAPSFIGPVRG